MPFPAPPRQRKKPQDGAVGRARAPRLQPRRTRPPYPVGPAPSSKPHHPGPAFGPVPRHPAHQPFPPHRSPRSVSNLSGCDPGKPASARRCGGWRSRTIRRQTTSAPACPCAPPPRPVASMPVPLGHTPPFRDASPPPKTDRPARTIIRPRAEERCGDFRVSGDTRKTPSVKAPARNELPMVTDQQHRSHKEHLPAAQRKWSLVRGITDQTADKP